MGNHHGSRLDGVRRFIFEMIEDQKDITLDEMVARLLDVHSVKIGRNALSKGYKFKKTAHALEDDDLHRSAEVIGNDHSYGP